ncbi:PLDc N-terminal domain-containing protein [Brevibacillus laterosporus]|uniref:PLDc N-terminal domain-containing protein n=2 Tax=Brevibacillus TaxID=55080 RepID=UPI003D2F887B
MSHKLKKQVISLIDMGEIIHSFFALLPIFLNIFFSIWAYRDSRSRGNSKEFSLIALIVVLAFPIIGLLLYLIIRRD